MHFRTLLLPLLLAVALLGAACGSTADLAAATPTISTEGRHVLTGEAFIREAMEISHLPDGSRIVIRLDDISIADGASVLIAESTSTSTMLPMTYELRWDTDLESGRDYSVSGAVYDADGALLFVSDTVHPFQPGDTDITVELTGV